jgi:hypothetical protein
MIPAHRIRIRIKRLDVRHIGWMLDRDDANGWPCPYCWQPMGTNRHNFPTWDHVVPVSAGGADSRANKLVVCKKCNGDKGARALPEYAGWLEGMDDIRHRCIDALIAHLLGEDDDPALRGTVHALRSRGLADGRLAKTRKTWLLPGSKPIAAPYATLRAFSTATQAVMRLGLRREHWLFEAPNTLRVSVDGVLVPFIVTGEDELVAAVRSYPRAKPMIEAAE